MPTNFVVDTLTDSNVLLQDHTGSLGATWTYVSGVGNNITCTSSGAVGPTNSDGAYYASGTAPTADYSVQCTFQVPTTSGAWNFGVIGRCSTTADTYVWALYNAGSGANCWVLYDMVAGNPTQIGTVTGATLSTNTPYTLELVLTGTTADLYVGGVLTCSATTAITANGRAGIHLYTSNATASNFSAFYTGTLTAGTASTVSVGNGTADVTCTAPSGGTSPYTYQWYRSTSSGSQGSAVSGATSLSLDDSGLTNGTTYYYELVVTDSASNTATSNQTSATPTAGGYTFTGPSSAIQHMASANFTVTPTSSYTGTITPSDGGAGGTFTPSSLTWSGSETAQTFVYTPAASGSITISTTSSPHVTDASPITLSVNFFATADNTAIQYVGKGAVVGSGASSRWKTINTGGQIYARLVGTETCVLWFDVTNCSSGQYPDILYVMDGGSATRVTLTSTGQVTCTFPTFSGVAFSGYTEHTLEIWAEGVFDAGTTNTNVWNDLYGALQFQGLELDGGASLAAFNINPYQIEFCGDSIVDTVHMLGSGSWSQTLKGGHLGWPALTAKALGMLPVGNGFPGDGLLKTSGGPSGNTLTYSYVPLGPTADPTCFAGQSYTPAITPSVVVVEYGTNDYNNGATSSAFQAAYLSFLEQKRTQYPKATIVALVLPSFASFESAVAASFTSFADSNSVLVNESAASYDTTDGVHLSYKGAVQLSINLASAIQTFLASKNINLNLNSDPGVSNVRSSVTYYINGTLETGTYAGGGGGGGTYPTAGQVLSGVTFGPSDNITGTLTVPSAGNVVSGIEYGAGGNQYTGTVTLPAIDDVLAGVEYGAGGSQYTGTLSTSGPTASQIATAVWTDLTSGGDFGTANSIGALVVSYLTKIKAAVFDSASVSGTTITLSTGDTQVISSTGRTTT